MGASVVKDRKLLSRLSERGEPFLVVPCKWKREESAVAMAGAYVILASSGMTGARYEAPIEYARVTMMNQTRATLRLYGESFEIEFPSDRQAKSFLGELQQKRDEITEAKSRTNAGGPLVPGENERLLHGTYLGGAHIDMSPGKAVDLFFREHALGIYLDPSRKDHQPFLTMSYSKSFAINLSGPGTFTTGTKFMGGGFGLVGAAEGIAIASFLNSITRKAQTVSIITVSDEEREGFFLHTDLSPDLIRQELSPVFVILRKFARSDAGSAGPTPRDDLVGALERLAALHDSGALSDEEFESAKAKLLG